MLPRMTLISLLDRYRLRVRTPKEVGVCEWREEVLILNIVFCFSELFKYLSFALFN